MVSSRRTGTDLLGSQARLQQVSGRLKTSLRVAARVSARHGAAAAGRAHGALGERVAGAAAAVPPALPSRCSTTAPGQDRLPGFAQEGRRHAKRPVRDSAIPTMTCGFMVELTVLLRAVDLHGSLYGKVGGRRLPWLGNAPG